MAPIYLIYLSFVQTILNTKKRITFSHARYEGVFPRNFCCPNYFNAPTLLPERRTEYYKLVSPFVCFVLTSRQCLNHIYLHRIARNQKPFIDFIVKTCWNNVRTFILANMKFTVESRKSDETIGCVKLFYLDKIITCLISSIYQD